MNRAMHRILVQAIRQLPLVLMLTVSGCGKKADSAPLSSPVPPEVASALQETFTFFDSPDPDPVEVCRRARELATRWNTGGHFATGLLARPSKRTFVEALFVINYGAHLNFGYQAPTEERIASFEAEKLTGYPETPEPLRAAWKSLGSCLGRVNAGEAKAACAAIRAQLWRRMKQKDSGVQAFLKRAELSTGGPAFLAILERQQYWVELIVEPTNSEHPVPLKKDGSPRYSSTTVEEAVENVFRLIVTTCCGEMGLDKEWNDLYGCSVSVKRADDPPRPGSKVAVRVRYNMKETEKTLNSLGNSIILKCLEIDLRLQFEQHGKPLGREILLHGATPEKITWDLSKENPDAALMQGTISSTLNSVIDQLIQPR